MCIHKLSTKEKTRLSQNLFELIAYILLLSRNALMHMLYLKVGLGGYSYTSDIRHLRIRVLLIKLSLG